jgi:hypothetical protein
MSVLYDTIGIDYSALRRPDPRIAAAIHAHMDGAASVLNAGAGAGSYEPTHLKVTAVEPSAVMIRQRSQSDAVVVQAAAEDLPFADKSFDASMAILTAWLSLKPCSDPLSGSLFRFLTIAPIACSVPTGAVLLPISIRACATRCRHSGKIGDVTEPLRRLKYELQSGEWERKYSRFLDQESRDFGYHLLVSRR